MAAELFGRDAPLKFCKLEKCKESASELSSDFSEIFILLSDTVDTKAVRLSMMNGRREYSEDVKLYLLYLYLPWLSFQVSLSSAAESLKKGFRCSIMSISGW